ncbi:MAG: biopolymer transporter ExbD, partial [Acinetobacter junii]
FKPDPQAEYKNIAMVMALAQQSKVTKIGIVSNN